METIQYQPKYHWENRLSLEARQEIINYYLQGYAPYTLMKTYNVSQCTIEHHLKAAGVYILFRKATKKGPIIRPQRIVMRSIVFPVKRRLITAIDDDNYYYDEYGYKYQKLKKTYADYLKEAANRAPILRDNDKLENKGVGDKFVVRIHVNLKEPTQSTMHVSRSVLSW